MNGELCKYKQFGYEVSLVAYIAQLAHTSLGTSVFLQLNFKALLWVSHQENPLQSYLMGTMLNYHATLDYKRRRNSAGCLRKDPFLNLT